MSISRYHLWLLVMFITVLSDELLVVTWFYFCWCPIYTKIVCKLSLVWQFVNYEPISASVADASTFFMILYSTCNDLFGSGISCGGFYGVLDLVLDRRNHPPWYFLPDMMSKIRHCICTVSCQFSCNGFLTLSEWRSS